jgi:hypothetical protein
VLEQAGDAATRRGRPEREPAPPARPDLGHGGVEHSRVRPTTATSAPTRVADRDRAPDAPDAARDDGDAAGESLRGHWRRIVTKKTRPRGRSCEVGVESV